MAHIKHAGRLTAAVAALAVTGCAATATGTQSSQMLMPAGELSTFNKETPESAALVVVRFPATVAPDAMDAYNAAFSNSPIGGSLSSEVAGSDDANKIAESVLVKSNYFAMSLYDQLSERLPDETVLLAPHEIKLDATGKLTSESVTGADDHPHVLGVEFVSYSFPDIGKMMEPEPITFGDLLTPLVVVTTDHRAKAPTQGVILASDALKSSAAGQGRSVARMAVSNFESGVFDDPERPLALIGALSGGSSASPPTRRMATNLDVNAVQSYGIEKVIIDRAAIDTFKTSPDTPVDPLASKYTGPLAQRLIDMLNDIDIDKAVMVDRAEAIAEFDNDIAALSTVGLSSPDYINRFSSASDLVRYERKFLSLQSEKLFEGIYDGEQGRQVREMIVSEYEVLAERRRLAQQQNIAAGAAVLSAVAAGAAASQDNFANDINARIAAQVATAAATAATVRAVSVNRQSKALGDNYLTAMAPALAEQIEIQVDVLGSTVDVTAGSFDQFRTQLQGLYADAARGLDTVSSECGFTHSDGGIGRWTGICNGASANGVGLGVITLADGTAVEYYGNAVNGSPEGVGYMIVHGASGTVSYEGEFRGGQPTGVVRVAAPGKPYELRIFDNGVDTGAAPEGSVAPSMFKNAPAAEVPVASLMEYVNG